MTDKMTTGERLDRIERAIAEHTQGRAIAKGEWNPHPGKSAAGDILAEWRTVESERQAGRDAKAAELRAQLEEVTGSV